MYSYTVLFALRTRLIIFEQENSRRILSSCHKTSKILLHCRDYSPSSHHELFSSNDLRSDGLAHIIVLLYSKAAGRLRRPFPACMAGHTVLISGELAAGLDYGVEEPQADSHCRSLSAG